MRVASGIFMWSAMERRSRRYGGFYMSANSFGGNAAALPDINIKALSGFVNKRVRIKCVVTENRESGHVGDAFLDILPSKPEVGETVDLGVGILELAKTDFESDYTVIVLRPLKNRDELWIDPNKLYRLHDQTVTVFVKETADEGSAKSQLKFKESGAIANGDGSLQISGYTGKSLEIERKVHMESLGDGLFSVETSYPQNRVLKVKEV